MNKKLKRQHATKMYAFLCVFFWASSFVSTKVILQKGNLSVMDLASLRYLFAAILLIPLAYVSKVRLPEVKDLPKFMLAGLLGYAAYMFFFNTAISMISSSTASVINAICPGLTAIFAYFMFREKISRLGVFALGISFFGILVLSLWKNEFIVNIGVLYMLGGAFCLSAYNITQRWFVKRYNPMEAMTYSLLSGSILLMVFNLSSFRLLTSLNGESWAHLIYLAVFPSIVSYYCWAKAMDCCKKTTEVTNFMFVTPVIATILSFIVIREFPSMPTYVGGAMILFGMILFQKDKNQ